MMRETKLTIDDNTKRVILFAVAATAAVILGTAHEVGLAIFFAVLAMLVIW